MEPHTLVSIVAGISGIVLGWLGRTKSMQKDARRDGALQSDVEYIKRGIDGIREDVRLQSQKVEDLKERVIKNETLVEETCKRMDRLEKVKLQEVFRYGMECNCKSD